MAGRAAGPPHQRFPGWQTPDKPRKARLKISDPVAEHCVRADQRWHPTISHSCDHSPPALRQRKIENARLQLSAVQQPNRHQHATHPDQRERVELPRPPPLLVENFHLASSGHTPDGRSLNFCFDRHWRTFSVDDMFRPQGRLGGPPKPRKLSLYSSRGPLDGCRTNQSFQSSEKDLVTFIDYSFTIPAAWRNLQEHISPKHSAFLHNAQKNPDWAQSHFISATSKALRRAVRNPHPELQPAHPLLPTLIISCALRHSCAATPTYKPWRNGTPNKV